MSFTWPLALLLLLAPGLLLAVYLVALRRRRRQAVRWSSLDLLREALPRPSRWRRHAAVALLLAALATLAVAAARPQVVRQVTVARTSIILALDVSLSMCASDVEPNRLAAAKRAAAEFVRNQPEGMRIGVVAFSGFAEIAVPPTRDREALVTAIDALTTGRGTAIGAAILKGLDAVAEVNPDVAPVGDVAPRPAPPGERVPSGDFEADIVVLLTDGRNTRGVEPRDAVPYAVERKVRVYTIGFGTTQPAAMACTAEQLGPGGYGPGFGRGGGFGGSGGFGGFGGGGGGFGGFGDGSPSWLRSALVADEETLRDVARQTGGTYHAAADAAELGKVFEDLPREVERQQKRQEVSWAFAALGALLVAGALGAAVRWSPYP